MLGQYRMPTLLTTHTPYANMVCMSNVIEQVPITGETIRHDGAEWPAEGPGGALWVIRWFSTSGNIAAMRFPGARTGHRSKAADIGEARREAARLIALVAAGKKG